MSGLKINVGEHAEFQKWMQMGLRETMAKALISTAVRLVQVINTETIPQTLPYPPVDRGIYRAGWRVEAKPNTVFLVNTVLHSVFIEDGVKAENVKPGRKMITALAGWVKRKGLLEGTNKKGPDAEAQGIAWGIAKKMQKVGIFGGSGSPTGYHVAGRAIAKFGTFFNEEFARELKKNLR